jgi:tRNA(adenine34) deaminase
VTTVAGKADLDLMGLALEQAREGMRIGEVPVGAVVAGPDGAVLAVAHNEREALHDPSAHAEVLALRRAGAFVGAWRLLGCTLVTTLEPCAMCAGAAVIARVQRIVIGAWDPKRGAVGSLWDVVRDRRLNHQAEVFGDVRAAECSALLEEFFAARR